VKGSADHQGGSFNFLDGVDVVLNDRVDQRFGKRVSSTDDDVQVGVVLQGKFSTLGQSIQKVERLVAVGLYTNGALNVTIATENSKGEASPKKTKRPELEKRVKSGEEEQTLLGRADSSSGGFAQKRFL
jgi:hypothetical protein